MLQGLGFKAQGEKNQRGKKAWGKKPKGKKSGGEKKQQGKKETGKKANGEKKRGEKKQGEINQKGKKATLPCGRSCMRLHTCLHATDARVRARVCAWPFVRSHVCISNIVRARVSVHGNLCARVFACQGCARAHVCMRVCLQFGSCACSRKRPGSLQILGGKPCLRSQKRDFFR